MRGSAGGRARAITQHAEAQQRQSAYLLNPNTCKKCGKDIPLEGRPVSIVRAMKFCSLSCACYFNSLGRKHSSNSIQKKTTKLLDLVCKKCGETFQAILSRGYCKDECRKQAVKESYDIEKARANRRAQMKQEEDVANNLRIQGWEVFYTSNCCDRIGIKDGRPYFLEFKLEGREELRTGQKRLSEVSGDQFKIIVHDKDGRRVERSTDGP
jgi:hypothetical protein